MTISPPRTWAWLILAQCHGSCSVVHGDSEVRGLQIAWSQMTIPICRYVQHYPDDVLVGTSTPLPTETSWSVAIAAVFSCRWRQTAYFCDRLSCGPETVVVCVLFNCVCSERDFIMFDKLLSWKYLFGFFMIVSGSWIEEFVNGAHRTSSVLVANGPQQLAE